jgi:serine/threonine protein kinase
VADRAHDIWAVGVTFFALLTNTFPWRTASVDDQRYVSFLSEDFHAAPWNAFSPPLLEASRVFGVLSLLISTVLQGCVRM